MSLFNDRGTIHVTLPGMLQGAPPKKDDRTTRKRDEFGLPHFTPNSQSFAHVKLTLFAGLDTSSIDMMTRWYLLEEMMHLPSYTNAGVKLFVEDEQAGAA